MKKSPQAIALSNQIKDKSKPVFRGRFGKKHSRKVKSAKWDKWRVPRGIDVVKNQESGAFPRPGYRTPKSLRFLHPSGYPEIVVYTEKELEGKKDVAVRIAGTVGKRKRKAIVEKALALNLMVLNR
ncbi:MAG: 50S ribosomal protein L32e [Candidatus Diapherotrites archaeon]|nr:50S ribosomal protein L32e [Candidatus Diapherotrites archaeon]